MANSVNTHISLVGEYYVCSMMHLKEWNASMTLKNYPGTDIFGYNPQTKTYSNIQVKTGKNKYTVLLGPNTKTFNSSTVVGPYVFVHILPDGILESYILKASDVIAMANSYIATNSSKGNGIVPIRFKWSALQPFKDLWNNLW